MEKSFKGVSMPEDEITQKVYDYFATNGFEVEGGLSDGFITNGGDFAIDIRGVIDDFVLFVGYQDFKPKKIVERELLALDERIRTVVLYRHLSDERYREQLREISCDPIYVSIDGVMTETTLYDYTEFLTRNVDYTKKKVIQKQSCGVE